jgi:hypothetical protein
VYQPGGDDLMPTYDRIVPSEQACHGTTEQILEWVALHWGLDRVFGDKDILKAVAWKESTWNQDGKGDLQSDRRCAGLELSDPLTGCFGPMTYPDPDYQSYGITQVKRVYWPNHRAARDSTPFNAQLWASFWAMNYEGRGWQKANTGCAWCAVGMWFNSTEATETSPYVTAVRGYLSAKPWR